MQKDGHVYDELLSQTIKGFYFWRCSTPIESKFAKFKGIDYSRKAGHPDDKVTIYTNAKGTKVHRNAQGGWTEDDLQPSGILVRKILRGEIK